MIQNIGILKLWFRGDEGRFALRLFEEEQEQVSVLPFCYRSVSSQSGSYMLELK